MHEIISTTGGHDDINPADYQLYRTAEQTLDDAAIRERYETFHWYYVGAKDSASRQAGNHPWPERRTFNGRRVYAVPVFSGVDVESGRLLHVSHDDWVHPDDPTSWFVAEGSLAEHRVTEYTVTSSHVDMARRAVLSVLTPRDVANWPAFRHPQLADSTAQRQRFELRLDKTYAARDAAYYDGLYGRRTQYDELDTLNSMRRVILEKRFAEYAEELERQLAFEADHYASRRGVLLPVGAYASAA